MCRSPFSVMPPCMHSICFMFLKLEHPYEETNRHVYQQEVDAVKQALTFILYLPPAPAVSFQQGQTQTDHRHTARAGSPTLSAIGRQTTENLSNVQKPHSCTDCIGAQLQITFLIGQIKELFSCCCLIRAEISQPK